MPIRKKLTFWYAGLLIILTFIIGTASTATMYFTLVGAIDDTLRLTAEEVIENATAFSISEFGAPTDVSVHLTPLDTFQSSGIYIQVWQTWDGDSVIAPRFADGSTNLGDYRAPLDSRTLGVSQPVYSEVIINDLPFRVYTRPIALSQGGTQIASVQVASSLQTVESAINRLLAIMVAGGVAAVIVAMGLGMMLSRMALQPVQDITQVAASIADTEDLRTRLPWKGPHDELGHLTSVFNHMMDRLEQLFRIQQRFVADVSHELRTPLTSILGNVEIIKRYGMDADSFEAIESEASRMSRLVNDLLLLARADYGELKIDLFAVDLDTVLSEVYRESKVLAKDRNLEVKIEEFAPLRVNGNADRLKQLFLNLVGNAIKFTPDGGKISFGLTEHDGDAIIRVTDTGMGIPEAEVERIFDRFYQVDTSRYNKGGAGLGLSIAKWIVDAHAGTIRAESQIGKGTSFIVTIPLIDSKPRATKTQDRPTRRNLRLPGLRSRTETAIPPQEQTP